jgi:hypothetical protein
MLSVRAGVLGELAEGPRGTTRMTSVGPRVSAGPKSTRDDDAPACVFEAPSLLATLGI